MSCDNCEKGYYSPVKIKEGNYYQIDIPLRLSKLEEVQDDDISYDIIGPCLANGGRYTIYLTTHNDILRGYVDLTKKEYEELSSMIGDLVRVTIFQLVETEYMFPYEIIIEVDEELRSIRIY